MKTAQKSAFVVQGGGAPYSVQGVAIMFLALHKKKKKNKLLSWDLKETRATQPRTTGSPDRLTLKPAVFQLHIILEPRHLPLSPFRSPCHGGYSSVIDSL